MPERNLGEMFEGRAADLKTPQEQAFDQLGGSVWQDADSIPEGTLRKLQALHREAIDEATAASSVRGVPGGDSE